MGSCSRKCLNSVLRVRVICMMNRPEEVRASLYYCDDQRGGGGRSDNRKEKRAEIPTKKRILKRSEINYPFPHLLYTNVEIIMLFLCCNGEDGGRPR